MNNKLSNPTFVKHNIYLDGNSEPWYDEDQAYISRPTRFPTVSFYVEASDGLTALADAIREAAGFLPMLPTETHPANYDMDGWYDFYIGINGFTADHMDSCIDCYVVSDSAEDNEAHYVLDIPEEARALIYQRLDEQAMEVFGKSCEELLTEATEEMSAHQSA